MNHQPFEIRIHEVSPFNADSEWKDTLKTVTINWCDGSNGDGFAYIKVHRFMFRVESMDAEPWQSGCRADEWDTIVTFGLEESVSGDRMAFTGVMTEAECSQTGNRIDAWTRDAQERMINAARPRRTRG